MRENYIDVKGPSESRLSIRQGDEITNVTCHWHVLGEGEEGWIDIHHTIDSRAYLWAVRALLETGRGIVEAANGSLILEAVGRQTRISITRNSPTASIVHLCNFPPRAFGPDSE